jgi:imidazolonepropionase-like amidohydrolase
MTVKQAIRAATYTAAEACGMLRDIGSIEAGKLADLLILKDDPTRDAEVLCNTENIRCIVTDGRLTVEEGRFAW